MATEQRETVSLIGSDKVEGTAVYGRDEKKIGSIERVMIDKMSGKVAYAVIGYGGFLGIGDDHYPTPWSSLKYDTRLGGYVVGITADLLTARRNTATTMTGRGRARKTSASMATTRPRLTGEAGIARCSTVGTGSGYQPFPYEKPRSIALAQSRAQPVRRDAAAARKAGGRHRVVAESCTAGRLATLLSDAEGAAQHFAGGFVTYTKDQKHRALGVGPALLREKGAVCGEVARAMAEGALARSGAGLAAAITGVPGRRRTRTAIRLGACASRWREAGHSRGRRPGYWRTSVAIKCGPAPSRTQSDLPAVFSARRSAPRDRPAGRANRVCDSADAKRGELRLCPPSVLRRATTRTITRMSGGRAGVVARPTIRRKRKARYSR